MRATNSLRTPSFQMDGGISSEDELAEASHCWQQAAALESSLWWGRVVTIVLLANTVAMSCEAEFREGFKDFRKSFGNPEVLFLAFFTFEVSLRVYVFGCVQFFFHEDCKTRNWNLFDLGITVLGIIAFVLNWRLGELFGLTDVESLEPQGKPMPGVLLLLNSARVLRIVRICEKSRKLRQLLRGVVKSFDTVFWIAVFGLMLVGLFALNMTSLAGSHSEEWAKCTNDDDRHCCRRCLKDDAEKVRFYFGDLGRSMFTAFQFIVLNEWSDIVHLVSRGFKILQFEALIYTVIASFALVSLLTGVMAEDIMAESKASTNEDQHQKVHKYVSRLQELFRKRQNPDLEGCSSNSGLSHEGLSEMLSDPQVARQVEKLGVRGMFTAQDLQDVFSGMDLDGNGVITWKEFWRGLQCIYGPATAKELSLVHADVKRLLLPDSAKCRAPSVHEVAAARASSCALRMHRLAAIEERMTRLEAAVLQLLEAEREQASPPPLLTPMR